ncbi:MAG TPA: F0F1 ATP synthase subunit B' [Rhodospirillales bacterium]|nr:F0F1 ATP synthase subunit B' [Rhodospirillales bacterium]
MPQFDPAVWSPQLVWLAITFAVFYLLMAKVALPRVGEVLEEREQRINLSLRRAEELKQSAEDAVAEYEKTIADVRAKALDEVRTARERAAAEAAAKHEALHTRLAAEVAAAEERIHRARSAAIAGLRDVAVTVAGAAVERLTGQKVESKALTAAVDASLGEQSR